LETAITVIGNPGTITLLKTEYGNAMDAYLLDSVNIDAQVKSVCDLFKKFLFINAANRNRVHASGNKKCLCSVFEKLNEVIKRWEAKQTEFDTVMAGYNRQECCGAI
jgi:hypothetical protein